MRVKHLVVSALNLLFCFACVVVFFLIIIIFIPNINQICQTSVLLILVTKRGPSNVKISRETSIVNASVAGREKHVKKVIGFHHLSYL